MKVKSIKAKLIERLLASVHADATNGVNTVVTTTGTVTDDGKAQKLDNHVRQVYSKEIMFKAQPVMKFMQFAKIKTELGVQPGLSIQMLTYENIKRGGKLTEGTHIKTNTMSSTMKEIKVYEYGNALAFSELAFRSSFTNLMEDATKLLGNDYAITLDLLLRDVALSAPNVIYARGTNADAVVANRQGLKTGLTTCTIKDAVEILATNNTPKIEGSYYVCFIHPHQSRELRDDPNWIDASKYAQPESLFNGEIGKYEDVRFIETTSMPNGAVEEGHEAYVAGLKDGGADSDKDVYQAVIFGDEYYGFAEALPVELRDGGVEDFGRVRKLAWYTIMGADKLNPARGIKIETL